ncbi:MAG: hypothetical protein OXI05_08200, partial [Bacteroidota bacterium]|nr:hypothetical protein [Bacteroidota bacterium]
NIQKLPKRDPLFSWRIRPLSTIFAVEPFDDFNEFVNFFRFQLVLLPVLAQFSQQKEGTGCQAVQKISVFRHGPV